MDRGIKKWAPYKSLVEHGYALNELSKNREKVEKPKISSEVAEEINEILCNYDGNEVVVGYYRRGFIYEITGMIKKIIPEERRIILGDNTSIKLSEVISLRYQ